MTCLLISDLHYALKQFDWVLTMAQAFQVVIIAGDHLDVSSTVDIRTQAVVLLKYFRRLHDVTQLIVCSGNHDLDTRNAAGEKIARWLGKARQLGVSTDGDSLNREDTVFTICPWWDGPQTRETVGKQLAEDALKPKAKWIWVYHAPPDASPTSWSGQKYLGDAYLKQWIEQYQTDMVLGGHIHQSPFRQGDSWVDRLGSTWVFNAGRYTGAHPAHIVFDTDAQMALWFSRRGRVRAFDQNV